MLEGGKATVRKEEKVGKTASVRLIPVPVEVWVPVRCSFLVVWP